MKIINLENIESVDADKIYASQVDTRIHIFDFKRQLYNENTISLLKKILQIALKNILTAGAQVLQFDDVDELNVYVKKFNLKIINYK